MYFTNKFPFIGFSSYLDRDSNIDKQVVVKFYREIVMRDSTGMITVVWCKIIINYIGRVEIDRDIMRVKILQNYYIPTLEELIDIRKNGISVRND